MVIIDVCGTHFLSCEREREKERESARARRRVCTHTTRALFLLHLVSFSSIY